jgi:hypothetical protein
MKLAVILCLGATLLHSAYGAVTTTATGADYFKGGKTEADDVTVSCKFTGLADDDAATTITWKVQGEDTAITSGSDYTIDTPNSGVDRTSTLTIPKATIAKVSGTTATYVCTTATGETGAKTADAVLTIYTYGAAITTLPDAATVGKGEEFTFTCTVSGLKDALTGNDKIEWQMADGTPIKSEGGYTITAVPHDSGAKTQGSTMSINTDDYGKVDVKCVVTAAVYGGAQTAVPKFVVVIGGAKTTDGKILKGQSKDSTTMKCDYFAAAAVPVANIKWYGADDVELTGADYTITREDALTADSKQGTTLVVKAATAKTITADTTYKCEFVSGTKFDVAAKVLDLKIELTGEKTVEKNKDLVLSCTVSGITKTPDASIEWKMGDTAVVAGTNYVITVGTYDAASSSQKDTLTVKAAANAEEGKVKYTCGAKVDEWGKTAADNTAELEVTVGSSAAGLRALSGGLVLTLLYLLL